tara:strand:+ start:178 stop:561 length:384 start_codon:yes stop_codon:yes gene_type:complete
MIGILSAVLPIVGRVLDRVIPDSEARAKAELEIQTGLLNAESEIVKAAASVIRSEASGNWLQRSWRPMLMILFGLIIANNYVIVPYVLAFGLFVPSLDIPPGMWALLNVGVGGYVVGRSAEKIFKNR